MSKKLGTIKFLEGRIVTKKDDVVEIWSRAGGDTTCSIVYDGLSYYLLKGKETNTPKKKYEEIEEDINLDNEDEF